MMWDDSRRGSTVESGLRKCLEEERKSVAFTGTGTGGKVLCFTVVQQSYSNQLVLVVFVIPHSILETGILPEWRGNSLQMRL